MPNLSLFTSILQSCEGLLRDKISWESFAGCEVAANKFILGIEINTLIYFHQLYILYTLNAAINYL